MPPKEGTRPWIERVWRLYKPGSNLVDAAGKFRVSQQFGILDNKNVSTSNQNQWHEEISGAILGYTSLTGSFGIGNEIRGTLPAGKIPIGTITEDTGSALTIDCSHNNFTVGDTIEDQTTGATAVLTTTNTGSDIQHNYDHAATVLKVGTGADDYAIRQSILPAAYVAGKGQNPQLTFGDIEQKANVVYRIGAFDDRDGPFLEVTETDIAFVIRSSTSGTPSDTNRVSQSQWNIDRLDGGDSGGPNPSRQRLDINKVQLVELPYLWQGVGAVYGAIMIDNEMIIVHEFKTANKTTLPYMRNPSLPLRYEIGNTGATASPTSFEEICSTISSEGGYNLPGLEFSASRGIVYRTVSARTPIFAIRLKNEFPAGKPNRRVVRFLNIGSIVGTNDALLEIAHIHEPVDFVHGGPEDGNDWQDVGGGSAVEYSVNITGFVGRPEHIVENDYIPTGQANKPSKDVLSSEFISLHSFLAQNFDSTNSQVFVVYATPFTSNSTVACHMTWIEFE